VGATPAIPGGYRGAHPSPPGPLSQSFGRGGGLGWGNEFTIRNPNFAIQQKE